MRVGFQGSNLKYYRYTLFAIVFFALDNLAYNWHHWATPELVITPYLQERLDSTNDPETKDWIIDSVAWQDERLTKEFAVSVLTCFMYLGFMFLMKKRNGDDWIDQALLFLGLASSILNARDHFLNNNTRPDLLDWYSFLFVFSILLILKLAKYPLWKITKS